MTLTKSLKEADIIKLITAARLIFASQPSLIEVNPPIQVCGDIHGQYPDLLRLFSKVGWPHQKSFLFLGDYVDRGSQQLETILLLIAYKIAFPQNFFMLRGNHECAPINRVYGFYDEVKRRYSVRLYMIFQDLFNMLPLTALIGSRIFCMHGGLSPQMRSDKFSWDDLRNIGRPLEIPEQGLEVDILWSDPEDNIVGWHPNSRGISYVFGTDVVHRFCEDMDIDLIARGHQVVQDGYQFFADRKLVTIFSAPKYCGEFDNSAASMSVDVNLNCKFKLLMPRLKATEIITTTGNPILSKRKRGKSLRDENVKNYPKTTSNITNSLRIARRKQENERRSTSAQPTL